jgi:hypothetical protein
MEENKRVKERIGRKKDMLFGLQLRWRYGLK